MFRVGWAERPDQRAPTPRDLNEVKSLGSATSTTRTADETDAAIWWQDHGVALWNRMLRNIAAGQELDIVGALGSWR